MYIRQLPTALAAASHDIPLMDQDFDAGFEFMEEMDTHEFEEMDTHEFNEFSGDVYE